MGMQMDEVDVAQHVRLLEQMAQLAWVNVHHATNRGDEDRYRRYAVALEDALSEAKKVLAFLQANPPPDPNGKKRKRMRP